jgi:hypothetical protein
MNCGYIAPTELKILLGLISTNMSRLRRWIAATHGAICLFPRQKKLSCCMLMLNSICYFERACEPMPGSDDGKWIFESILAVLKNKTAAQAA